MIFSSGLSIEAGTMVCLILAIGLAIDYSSHIGYKFMIYTGTREERARFALINMGPAVFNGGFSTFLPIVMLSGSNIYVTMTFFKVSRCFALLCSTFCIFTFTPLLFSVSGDAGSVEYKKQRIN